MADHIPLSWPHADAVISSYSVSGVEPMSPFLPCSAGNSDLIPSIQEVAICEQLSWTDGNLIRFVDGTPVFVNLPFNLRILVEEKYLEVITRQLLINSNKSFSTLKI